MKRARSSPNFLGRTSPRKVLQNPQKEAELLLQMELIERISILKKKLMRSYPNLKSIREVAKNLCDKDSLKASYLSYDPKQYSKNEKIRIKLVISDQISKNKNSQNIRKWLSPFMSGLNLAPQFGLFHSALVVGPYYLQWTNVRILKICSN